MIMEIYDNKNLENVEEIEKDYIEGEVYDYETKETYEFEAVRYCISDEFEVRYTFEEPCKRVQEEVQFVLPLLESDIIIWGHTYNNDVYFEWDPYQFADFRIGGGREVTLNDEEFINMIDVELVDGLKEEAAEHNVSPNELLQKAIDCIGWSVEGFNSAISLEGGKMDVWQWTSGTVIEEEEREKFIWEVSSSEFDEYPQPSEIEDLLVVWIEDYQNY